MGKWENKKSNGWTVRRSVQAHEVRKRQEPAGHGDQFYKMS